MSKHSSGIIIGPALVCCILLGARIAFGADWPQWRGVNRDNLSPEKGLAKDWPEAGPPLEWRVDGVGTGIASPTIAHGRIMTLGYFAAGEYLTALDQRTTQRLWVTRLGPLVNENPLMRWLSQRSPTLDEDRVYAITAGGRLACLDAHDGHELWSKNYPTDYAALNPPWGFCDYPLVDGDKVIITPGGPEASIVALDKRTGREIWRSVVPQGGRAAYAALVVSEGAGVRQYVAFLGNTLAGIRASDGLPLWRYDKISQRTANSHTPLVLGDQILASNGYGSGQSLVKLLAEGEKVEVQEQFRGRLSLDAFQDSGLIVGDHFFASGGSSVVCADWKTGKKVWEGRSVGGGKRTMTSADNLLYVRNSEGWVVLAEVSPKAFVEHGRFKIPDTTPGVGATSPILAGGRMYIRDENKLFCYDIRPQSTTQLPAKTRSIVFDPPPAVDPPPGEPRERTLRSVFVPTPQDIVEKMLELAVVQKTDVLYDLGSGDGRIVITAAKKYGVRAVGYELDKDLVATSREAARAAKVDQEVAFEIRDLFTAELRGVSVLAVFLLPAQLEKLWPQLEQMQPGSRLVSHQFLFPDATPDKTVQVRSTEDGQMHAIHIYHLPLSKLARRMEWTGRQITHAAFSPDGRLRLAGADTNTLRVWETATGKQLVELPAAFGLFTAQGKYVVGHSRGKSISLFDSTTGAVVRTWEASSEVLSLAVAPTANRVLTGHKDNVVRLWSLTTGERLREFEAHAAPPGVAISSDGQQILSTSADSVRLYEGIAGQLQRKITPFPELASVPNQDLRVQAFSLSGRSIAACVWDERAGGKRMLRIWDSRTGNVKQTFELGVDHQQDVALTPDGWSFLTAHADQTIRFRDISTGNERRRVTMHGVSAPQALAVSPDGGYLMSGSNHGWINLWQLSPMKPKEVPAATKP